MTHAVEGRIKFTDYFDYDYSRLLDVFILRCVEQNLISFSKIEDVCAIEQLEDGFDKYGLSNVTTSDFERQGFTQDNQFFLYNIFFDTSIGSANAKVPQTIEILKKYVDDHISIYMRKDSALSVPTEKKVISATLDMQKWRGITLNLNDLEAQIRYGKEVTVHFDPQTMHKVIAIVKAAETDDREKYYHIKRSRFRLMLMEPKESHMGVMALVDMVCCALQTVTLLKHGKIMFVIFTILVFPTGMLRLKSKSIQ